MSSGAGSGFGTSKAILGVVILGSLAAFVTVVVTLSEREVKKGIPKVPVPLPVPVPVPEPSLTTPVVDLTRSASALPLATQPVKEVEEVHPLAKSAPHPNLMTAEMEQQAMAKAIADIGQMMATSGGGGGGGVMNAVPGPKWIAHHQGDVVAPTDAVSDTVRSEYPWRRFGSVFTTEDELVVQPLFIRKSPFGFAGEYEFAVKAGGTMTVVREGGSRLKKNDELTIFGRTFRVQPNEAFQPMTNLVSV